MINSIRYMYMSCILSQHFVGSIARATIVPSFCYFQMSLGRQYVLCIVYVLGTVRYYNNFLQ